MRKAQCDVFMLGFFTVTALATSLRAQDTADNVSPNSPPFEDVRNRVPIVAYAYSANGAPAAAMGLQLYGTGLIASGQDAVLGGGGLAWFAPINRLTIVLDAKRDVWQNFSPSGATLVQLFGSPEQGFTLSALGKFKIDGFAGGPTKDEVESEIELGALVSLMKAGWSLDANAILGRGLGDDGETDTEGRLRVMRDIGDHLRLGIDGQARARLSGPRDLPSGRSWDFAAGMQVLVGAKDFFFALTTGPSTMGMTNTSVGWASTASIGGTTL